LFRAFLDRREFDILRVLILGCDHKITLVEAAWEILLVKDFFDLAFHFKTHAPKIPSTVGRIGIG
jgi:hypothetical protein